MRANPPGTFNESNNSSESPLPLSCSPGMLSIFSLPRSLSWLARTTLFLLFRKIPAVSKNKSLPCATGEFIKRDPLKNTSANYFTFFIFYRTSRCEAIFGLKRAQVVVRELSFLHHLPWTLLFYAREVLQLILIT